MSVVVLLTSVVVSFDPFERLLGDSWKIIGKLLGSFLKPLEIMTALKKLLTPTWSQFGTTMLNSNTVRWVVVIIVFAFKNIKSICYVLLANMFA